MEKPSGYRLLKGENEMYKNRVENFLVGNNIDVSILREETERDTHYVLLKISLFGKSTYAVCALGDGYSFEVLGEKDEECNAFFELILRTSPSPCHIYDVVSDFRHENL